MHCQCSPAVEFNSVLRAKAKRDSRGIGHVHLAKLGDAKCDGPAQVEETVGKRFAASSRRALTNR